jgi:hypothetical protein
MRRGQSPAENGCSPALRRKLAARTLYLGPMRSVRRAGIILAMTRPTKSPRVLAINDRRTPSDAATQPVRRYRVARLRLDARIADSASRFEHLKRTYD